MNKKTFLKNALFMLALFFSMSLSAQNEPEILKSWTPLEDAKFHYDVSYTIVKCNADSNAIVLLNAFNEGGAYSKVGFTLNFSDENGNTSQKVIVPFASKLGDMFIARCNSEEYSNLKFDFPSNIDLASMKIEITYQTQS
jgi:hypothetical protein